MALHGFNGEELQAPMSEINTTPLVDVMLVLMVIFLVTAPMMTQAVPLQLPKEPATNITGQTAITLSVDKNGAYFWDEEQISDKIMEERLREISTTNPNQPIYLRADTNTVYGRVNHALAVIQRAGLSNIELLTEPN